jgi:energy-coupling factor transport system ATP-binding protein
VPEGGSGTLTDGEPLPGALLVAVEDARYRYPTAPDWVLRGASLELRRGDFVGLVGTTGAGKSTLCLTLNGLIPHYAGGVFEGRVVVDGLDTRGLTVADLSARVGLVFQDADAQLVMSTVEEECLLGPLSQDLPRAEARRRARRMLGLLEIGHLAGRPPQILSGGQKQRAAIAAVLACEPEVLVLDEATSELDALTVHKLFELCGRLNRERGTTVLIVSHEMELLAAHAGRLALMREGRIVLQGSPRAVFRSAEAFRLAGVRLPQVAELAVRLGRDVDWPRLPLSEAEAEPALRQALAPAEPDGRTHPPGDRGRPARPVASGVPGGPEDENGPGPPGGEPVVRVEGVRFAYSPGVDALKRLDLRVHAGELTAIIGNNGSGKSTLMKLLVGLLKPAEGRVVVDGTDTRGAKVSALARRIGFIFQNPNDQLFAGSVEEEVAFGLRNLGLPPEEIAARVEATLERFDLVSSRGVFPRFLSRGDKQKVCIASIVAMRPRILLLDEPTTGQDHRDTHHILELVAGLNAAGMTVLLVTHDLINVAAYARRVIVLADGAVVRDGPTAEVLADEALLRSCSLVAPQVVRLSRRLADFGLPLALRVADLAEAARPRLRGRRPVV